MSCSRDCEMAQIAVPAVPSVSFLLPLPGLPVLPTATQKNPVRCTFGRNNPMSFFCTPRYARLAILCAWLVHTPLPIAATAGTGCQRAAPRGTKHTNAAADCAKAKRTASGQRQGPV